jgi:H/ACA ribonucleoprotein complex non-core subunit NAF1
MTNQQPKKPKKIIQINPLAPDEGDEEDSTYNKFKTANEIEIGEAYKTGPSHIELDSLDEVI